MIFQRTTHRAQGRDTAGMGTRHAGTGLDGDEVVGVYDLAPQFWGQITGGAADQFGQFRSIEADHSAGDHVPPPVDQFHHIAGLEVTLDAGDARSEQRTPTVHHRAHRPIVELEPAGRTCGMT